MVSRKTVIIIVVLIIIGLVYALFSYLGLTSRDLFDGNGTVIVDEEALEDEENEEANEEVSDTLENPSYEIEEVVRDLSVPWSIRFTSENRMLITERNGSVRVVQNGTLLDRPIKTFVEVSTGGEEGLMGMTLHPNYASNSYIYFSLAYEEGENMFVKVVRLTDQGNVLTNEEILIDRIPAAQFHAGSEIAFGPDGKLYITTGDATDGNLAQERSSLSGKILRINDDGSIPADNPFPGSAIWSLGHRNPQGIDWQPRTGDLFATEHGPSGFDGPGGGDEINRIVKRANYGWPVVSHEESQTGFADPLLVFTPAIAPASGAFYTGDVFPEWNGDLFVGMLRGEGIMRIHFSDENPTRIVLYEKLDGIEVGRVREVWQGPDELIYFTTSNTDGRGNPRNGDDKVYRIKPTNS